MLNVFILIVAASYTYFMFFSTNWTFLCRKLTQKVNTVDLTTLEVAEILSWNFLAYWQNGLAYS